MLIQAKKKLKVLRLLKSRFKWFQNLAWKYVSNFMLLNNYEPPSSIAWWLFYLLKLEIMEMTNDNTTIIGTVSGTILSVVAMFDAGDIIKTVILAAIGAAVSFLVSRFLKWVWGKIGSKN